MFDKKSEYALNKYDQDSIIYISVSGRIRLTRADFSSEEEFLKWKAWSDADYHETEKNRTNVRHLSAAAKLPYFQSLRRVSIPRRERIDRSSARCRSYRENQHYIH